MMLIITFGIFVSYLIIDKWLDLWSGKITLDYQLKQQRIQYESELLKQASMKEPPKIEGFLKNKDIEEEVEES